MSNQPCRVAFVGAGAMAREHIRAFADVPDVVLAGITNRTADKARALAAESGMDLVASSIADLHGKSRADLVQVSVYETAIRPVMEEVLAFPWVVLMEKPVGLTPAEARDIQAMAQARGRRVFVGLNRRALSSTMAVAADLADDPNPRFIHVQDQQSLETALAIGHDAAVVRNWMFANSIHLVDYFAALGRGDIVGVDVINRWDPAAPGIVLARLRFSSGDLGLYAAVWSGPGPWSCTVTTKRRRWELRPLERAAYQDAGTRAIVPVEPHEWDTRFKPGFRRQAGWAIDAASGLASPLPTLDDGVRMMELTGRIYEPDSRQ